MFQIEVHNAIWIFLVLLMIHDFEELISVENWSNQKRYLIKNTNNRLKILIWKFWDINSYSFAKRDIIIFLVASAIVFLKVQFIESYWSFVLFNTFLYFVLLHNLVHLLQTIILKTYTPGFYTAIFIVTPYAILLLFHL